MKSNRRKPKFNKEFKKPEINKRDTKRTKQRDVRETKQVKEVKQEKDYEDIVEGRNAVTELIKSGKDINKLFIQRGEKHGSINMIIALAKEYKVVTVEVDRAKLDSLSQTKNHQGVIAIVPPFDYCEIEDILADAKSKNEDPFILMLDGIEDPHNLGSIIRTAETAGVHGIVIPKRRAVGVNATVNKTSAGATQYMKVARVNNLVDSIKELKEAGLWFYGTDMSGKSNYNQEKLTGPICIVIGSEGFGISKLIKEHMDVLVKIPMKGQISSLNASVSAGIVIYEVLNQRNSLGR